MQQSLPYTTNPHTILMENLSRDLLKYISSLDSNRSHSSTLFIKFLIMCILVILTVILYIVASSYNVVLGMRVTNGYLTSESSPSIQTNQSYCLSSTCVQTAAQIIQSLNPAVDPCEDFYEFTCGGWIRKRPITDDQSSITEFGRLRNDLNQKIKKLLNLKVKSKEPKYMEYMRLIYKQCLNTNAIEKEESKPLIEVLEKVGGWPLLNANKWNETEFDLIDTLIKIKDQGYSHLTLFSIHPGVDIKNNTNYLINIDQCSFSLSSRKYYLSNRDNKLLSTYRSSIIESAILLNATNKSKLDDYANQITDFEKLLATTANLPENRRNYTRIYNKMTVKELEEFAPNTDWTRLLTGFTDLTITPDTIVNIKELDYVRNVDQLLTKADKFGLANYLIWRVVFSSMPQLSNDWRRIYEKLNRIVSGRKSEKQRWSTCMQKLFNSFNVPLSGLYVKTYFDAKSKKIAEEMISNIKQEFIKILSTIEWMDDPSTRARAIRKAEQITTYVGYSPEILDENKVMELYQGLELNEKWNFFTNVQKLRKHWTDLDFKKLTSKNLKTDWKKFSEAATINAFYNSLENAIKFPSGILTGIFFDKNRPKYLNYGALGYIVGHEICHAFDDKGRQFDENGNFKNWWLGKTDEKFKQMSNCLVDQYNSYLVETVNMSVNGQLTIGENLADNAGLKQAFSGYRRHVEQDGEDPLLPGLNYTQNQLFWISSASIWCSNYRPEAMKARITTGVHSPPKYRVWGSVTNNLDFAKDFNCKRGSKMNPIKKCSVW